MTNPKLNEQQPLKPIKNLSYLPEKLPPLIPSKNSERTCTVGFIPGRGSHFHTIPAIVKKKFKSSEDPAIPR